MNQQDELEARYRDKEVTGDIPARDPFPRMIVVCIGITMVLFVVIMGFLFVDFVAIRSNQNVRPAPVFHNATPSTSQSVTTPPEKSGTTPLNP